MASSGPHDPSPKLSQTLLPQLAEALDWGAYESVKTVLDHAGEQARDACPASWLLLARCHLDVGDVPGALECLQRVRGIGHFASTAGLWEGRTWAISGDRRQADAALRRARFDGADPTQLRVTEIWVAVTFRDFARVRSLVINSPPEATTPADAFGKNLTALYQTHPAVAERIAVMRPWDQFQIVEQQGAWTPYRRTGTEPAALFDPVEQQRHEARSLADCEPHLTITEPVLVVGLGTGRVIGELLKIQPRHGKQFAILAVLSNWDELGAMLLIHDWSTAIETNRIHFVAGESNEFLAYFQNDLRRLPPSGRFAVCRVAPALEVTRIEQRASETVSELAAEARREFDALHPYYASEEYLSRWRPAGASGGLRVLIQACRYTTFVRANSQALADAFRADGHEVLFVDEGDDPHHWVGLAYICRQVASFRPDLYLRLNFLRQETSSELPPGLPFVTWIQDECPTHFHRCDVEHLLPTDFLVGSNKYNYVVHGYPRTRFLSSVVPSSVARFESPAETTGPFEYDITYVSHHSQTPSQWIDTFRKGKHSAEQQKWVARIYALLTEARAEGRVVYDVRRSFGAMLEGEGLAPVWPAWLVNFQVQLSNLFFRQTILEWISDAGMNLHLFGNGWSNHPTLGRHAHGAIEYGTPLRDLYRCSRINLQLTVTGNMHQRLVDGLLAGAFFMMWREPQPSGLVCVDQQLRLELLRTLLREPISTLADIRRLAPAQFETLVELGHASAKNDVFQNLAVTDPHDRRALLLAEAELTQDELVWFPEAEPMTFSSHDELIEKLQYWLPRDQERRKLVREIQERGDLRVFTGEHQVVRLIRWLMRRMAGATNGEDDG